MATVPRAAPPLPVRVAPYMRMSTNLQRYSIENQTRAIAAYTAAHGMAVVRGYRDEGAVGGPSNDDRD